LWGRRKRPRNEKRREKKRESQRQGENRAIEINAAAEVCSLFKVTISPYIQDVKFRPMCGIIHTTTIPSSMHG
jgi:hypothetical protein